MSLSIKKRGLFYVTVLSDKIHLFAVLHADVDVNFLLISFTCAVDIKWTPNGFRGIQDMFSLVHVDLQIQL